MFEIENHKLTNDGIICKSILTKKERLIDWRQIRNIIHSPFLEVIEYKGTYCDLYIYLKNGEEILIRSASKEQAELFLKTAKEKLGSKKVIETSEKFKSSIKNWWLEGLVIIFATLLLLIFLFFKYRL